jgi:hypothetical protein
MRNEQRGLTRPDFIRIAAATAGVAIASGVGVRRYGFTLPVEFGHSRSRTRDISASGVFLKLETDRTFSAGASVSFTLLLEHFDEVMLNEVPYMRL